MGPIIVLGMCHSGTSCLAETLIRAGVDFGSDLYPGAYEDRRVSRLHDVVTWMDPREPKSYGEAALAARDDFLKDRRGLWGFKEPRTLFTWKLWKGALESPRFVGTFRPPGVVIDRLIRRGCDPKKAENVWFDYNRRLLEFEVPMVCFDYPKAMYARKTAELLRGLELPVDAASMCDLSLRHDTRTRSVSGEVLALYEELLHAVRKPAPV